MNLKNFGGQLNKLWDKMGAQIFLFDLLPAGCEHLFLINPFLDVLDPLMSIPRDLNKGKISNRAENAKLKRFPKKVAFREKYFLVANSSKIRL